MKKENITLSMEAEKLRATKRYMEKKDAVIEQELAEALTTVWWSKIARGENILYIRKNV